MEDVLEATVIGLENRVLRRKVDGELAGEPVVERRACKRVNAVVEVVHAHRDTGTGSLKNLELHRRAAVGRRELHCQGAGAVKREIGGAVLVTECVTTNDDRLVPAGNETRDVRNDDGLAEDYAVEDVTNGAVRRLPHLFEAELFDTRLIRRDGCTLDSNTVLLDRVGGVDRDLVFGRVTRLHAEVVVLEVHIEVRVDEGVLDGLPNDAGHFIAIEFDDGAFNLDFLDHENSLKVDTRPEWRNRISLKHGAQVS